MALATVSNEVMHHYQHQMGCAQFAASQQLGAERYARQEAETKLQLKEKECQKHLAQLTSKGRQHKEEKAALLRSIESLKEDNSMLEERITKELNTDRKRQKEVEDLRILLVESQEQNKKDRASAEKVKQERDELKEKFKQEREELIERLKASEDRCAALEQKVRILEESNVPGSCILGIPAARLGCGSINSWFGELIGSVGSAQPCARSTPASASSLPSIKERWSCSMNPPTASSTSRDMTCPQEYRAFDISAPAATLTLQQQRMHLNTDHEQQQHRTRAADADAAGGADADTFMPTLEVVEEELAGAALQEQEEELQAPASLDLVQMEPRDVCTWDADEGGCEEIPEYTSRMDGRS